MFSSSPLKFLQTFLWLLALQISNTTMGQNKCCWCCNWQIIEDQQVKVVAQRSYNKIEKEEYRLQVNKYESRMKEAISYIKSALHSWTLPKQLSTSPTSIIQVLWGTFFATNHPGKCFDPPPSSQYMDFVTMQHSFFHGGGVLILTLSIHPCNKRVNSDTQPPHRTTKVCNTGPRVCNFHYTSQDE